MNTVSMNALAAVHTVAGAIAGYVPDTELGLEGMTCLIRSGQEFTELRFPGCSKVVVSAPRRAYGDTVLIDAAVNWSSSDSSASVAEAVRTARVLSFAAQVADQLNEWVASGDIEPRS